MLNAKDRRGESERSKKRLRELHEERAVKMMIATKKNMVITTTSTSLIIKIGIFIWILNGSKYVQPRPAPGVCKAILAEDEPSEETHTQCTVGGDSCATLRIAPRSDFVSTLLLINSRHSSL